MKVKCIENDTMNIITAGTEYDVPKSIDYINISGIKEFNGKTVKENNIELKHNISVDTLVEVMYDTWFGKGACKKVHARLFVFEHTRDCDGTPLYSLSERKKLDINPEFRKMISDINEELAKQIVDRINVTCICESDITIIEVTDDIKEGKDCLGWEE